MKRPRIAFYAILAVAGLIVGAQVVFASTDSAVKAAPSAPILTATPTVEANRAWNIAGTIQAMNGEFWNVQGFAVRVDSTTRIIGDLPSIGSYVEAKGTVQSDGTWLATELHVGHANAVPAETATGTPVPEHSLPTAIQTATVTSTATPTATSTTTVTVAPEVVPSSEDAETRSDSQGENAASSPHHPGDHRLDQNKVPHGKSKHEDGHGHHDD